MYNVKHLSSTSPFRINSSKLYKFRHFPIASSFILTSLSRSAYEIECGHLAIYANLK